MYYRFYQNSVITMVLLLLLLPMLLIGYRVIFGVFARKLAKKKGYDGYFWTGFFFTIIGLIYVVGLPVEMYAKV